MSRASSIISALNNTYNFHGKTIMMGGITLLNHSIQTARLMDARSAGCEVSIVSALLHDYGHMLESFPNQINHNIDNRHGILGARALREMGFPEDVTAPIRNHVMMKRYLITTDEHYKLPETAKKSLLLQGGKISYTKLDEVRKNKYYRRTKQLRIADDDAHELNIDTSSILEFHDCLEAVLIKKYK